MAKWVLATGNQGKLNEMQAMLKSCGHEVVSQAVFDCPVAVEDGLSFVENAIIKARSAAKHSGLPALADDSGLEVAALNGQPGIYSSRFAGAGASDQDNIAALLKALESVSPDARNARFRCVLVFVRHAEDPSPLIFEGDWHGEILEQRMGDQGFGYDPVFWLDSLQRSAALLSAAEKNAVSHRGQAMAKFKKYLDTHHDI